MSRLDLDIIQQWVPENARILDLGCGDGTLLKRLYEQKGANGYGLEIDRQRIVQCLERGVNVIEQDLNEGLNNFPDDSFDVVIMTQTLQAMHRPDQVLEAMLRIGRNCIVTFPNFGNWRARLHLALKGRMPVTKQLAYQWYDTPNIHFCTVKDFDALCRAKQIKTLDRAMVAEHKPDAWFKNLDANLFSETAIYHLSR